MTAVIFYSKESVWGRWPATEYRWKLSRLDSTCGYTKNLDFLADEH